MFSQLNTSVKRTWVLINSFCLINGICFTQPPAKSQWVYHNPQGKLVYKTLEAGDRIMDFSHAGYMGGGVSIPSPPVKITLEPAAGDNSDFIQIAIDKVSAMKPENGFRGTVLLKPGIYNCEKTIVINANGVVLRGSGSGKDGTVIQMTGKPHHCITVRGTLTTRTAGDTVYFTDPYVPS